MDPYRSTDDFNNWEKCYHKNTKVSLLYAFIYSYFIIYYILRYFRIILSVLILSMYRFIIVYVQV